MNKLYFITWNKIPHDKNETIIFSCLSFDTFNCIPATFIVQVIKLMVITI